MHTKKKDYFVTANSSAGFYNLIEFNIADIDKIYVLTGNAEICKQRILENMVFFLNEKISSMEILHSSNNPDVYDGLIFRECSIAVINSRLISNEKVQSYDSFSEINVNKTLSKDSKNILPIVNTKKKEITKYYLDACEYFKSAIKIHDELEKIYISNMDFSKADSLADELIKKIFNNTLPTFRDGKVYHRFFGGATWKGAVDYVESLTNTLSKRYFLKGRPGSGKSTILKRLQQFATFLGYDVEVYHCGFDPDSLDMILIDELDFCIFDSTSPHEYFPEKESDEIIDLYKELISEGTDEANSNALTEITLQYKDYISLGTECLRKAHIDESEINSLYSDFILEKQLFTLTINLIIDVL